MQGLIGKKVGMTQIFSKETGKVIPITVIHVGNNVVCQVKTAAHDGYSAVQLSYDTCSEKNVSKPELGHFKKYNAPVARVIKEFKPDSADEQFVSGQAVSLDVFDAIKFVDVVGISKGRGFAGGIKRHNFKRGRETHGCKAHRQRGSLGANTTPGRVVPGLRMEGHYGAAQVTARKLELIAVDKEAGLVMVKGAVPGPNRGVVYIKKNLTK
jgi:large subunit ribosomal protein L3